MFKEHEKSLPECCDMRGMLSFMILWLLTKKPMHGQEIAKEIGMRRGKKPNPGTIYPALEELWKKGLVKKESEGRKTIYSLTAEGRKGIKKACMYFCGSFSEIFEEYKNFCK
jgi:PadR family transcriptional regulator, regulatory protein PadR